MGMGLRATTVPAALVALIATGLLAGCGGADSAAPSQVVTSPASAAPSGAPSAPSTTPSAVTGAPSAATGAPPTAAGSPPRIIVRRTGGFVGVEQMLTVRPDGEWAWTGVDSGGGPNHGRLTGAQRAELARLAAEPALAEEARQKPAPPQCADGYDYVLTVGSMRVVWIDCDPVTPPTAVAITDLLAAATPL
jgi:hypothetical protein